MFTPIFQLPYRVSVELRNRYGSRTLTYEALNVVSHENVTSGTVVGDITASDVKLVISRSNRPQVMTIAWHGGRPSVVFGQEVFDIVSIDGHDPSFFYHEDLRKALQ